ncbi:MAG: hypothetical protein JXQ96_03400 [Cyclobacteriaceae bacterium]
MPKPLILSLIAILVAIDISVAQVINDNIENRLELSLNETHHSETTDCTVQWECVDESLTGKEVEYHNDQWFYFNTSSLDNYFINISDQKCRDQRGVQLIVIDGQPCQPETYEIISCVSLATHDDIFVELNNLKKEHSYLVNIDGYLNDFCSFDITVSDRPTGLPLNEDPISDATFRADAEVITIHWKIPEEDDRGIHLYQIFRKGKEEKKHKLIGAVAHERDVYGHFKTKYSYKDSVINPRTYDYKIVALTQDANKTLIAELNAYVRNTYPSAENNIELLLTSSKKTKFKVLIYDAKNDKLLLSDIVELKDDLKTINYFKTVKYNISEFKEIGISSFKVLIINQRTKARKEQLFYR